MIGLLRPFSRDQKRSFAVAEDDEAIKSRIEAIVASGGELPWKPELDGKIDRLRNQNNTPMRGQFARVYVGEALKRFEPGVAFVDVKALDSADESMSFEITAERADRTIVVPVRV